MIRRNQNTDQHSSQGDGPTAKQPLKEKALVCGRPHDIDPARRKMLVDIAEANYTMRRQWGVPRTVAVAFSTVMAPKCRGNLPLVSFSASSTADALLSLAKKNIQFVASILQTARQLVGVTSAVQWRKRRISVAGYLRCTRP